MSKLRILIVGGGSNAWTPTIVRDCLLTESLSDAEDVLYDINKPAGDLVKAVCDKLARQLGVKARFVSTDKPARAFAGARYVIITISTGGLDAMAHDLAIPEKYGIYHTVGDTSGPGGWARTIRNFDPFVALAAYINKHAPGAVVLNYTNPMTCLTDVLSRLCEGPVVGLCHGLFENLAFLKDFYKLASEDDLTVQYGGLNHFFWITEARAGGIDVVADLQERLKKQTFTDLLAEAHKDEMGFSSNREIATELFRLTGVMPYLGDRHTCEFFPWYITNKANMRKYQIVRSTIAERRKAFGDRDKNLKRMVDGKLPEDYVRRSRETAADIIDAHSRGRTFIDVGNVPNVGQIVNLPYGSVVETAVRVDANGFTPIAAGPLPEPIATFVESWTKVFDLTVESLFTGDKKLALQALRLDPLCSHLNTDQVNEMGDRLLGAHKKHISAF